MLLELRRYKPDDNDDRQRVLSGLGRFDEIPTEIVVMLAEDGSGYSASGDKKAEAAWELRTAILDTLTPEPTGAIEIHALLPEAGRPRRGDVMKALRAGADAGLWTASGTGKPKDPWRFSKGE